MDSHENPIVLSGAQTIDAANIAADVARKAVITAQDLLAKAEETAKALRMTTDEHAVNVAADALRKVFGENEDRKIFIDVGKIPLLCKSVIEIRSDIAIIKQQLKPILWGISLIGGAIILALVGKIMNLL